MKKLRVDEVRRLLPELDELRPLLDRVMSDSIPDPDRRWTASGELGTLDHRLVRPELIEKRIPEMAREAAARLESMYGILARAVTALSEGDGEGAVNHLLDAAEAEERADRFDRSEGYAQAAHELARGLRDRRPALRALRQGARAARGQGRLEAAQARYEEAHQVAGMVGERVGGAVAAIGRGNVAIDRGIWMEAKGWYHEALELLGDETRSEHWHVYLNLSIVHRSLGELEASTRWLARAERVAAELGDPNAEAILGNARGQLLMVSERWEQAEGVFRSALEMAPDAQARVVIAVNLGEALLARGRVLEAAEVARGAEETAIVSDVLHRLPEVYRLLGAIAGARGLEDGFVFFEQALELVKERKLPDFEAGQTLEAYGKFEIAAGRTTEAAAHLREAARIYGALGSGKLRARVLTILNEIQVDEAPASTDEGRDHESI